jgi:hypothetical protein
MEGINTDANKKETALGYLMISIDGKYGTGMLNEKESTVWVYPDP